MAIDKTYKASAVSDVQALERISGFQLALTPADGLSPLQVATLGQRFRLRCHDSRSFDGHWGRFLVLNTQRRAKIGYDTLGKLYPSAEGGYGGE